MHTGVHRFLAFELLVNHASSGTLAFSLHLVSFLHVSFSGNMFLVLAARQCMCNLSTLLGPLIIVEFQEEGG